MPRPPPPTEDSAREPEQAAVLNYGVVLLIVFCEHNHAVQIAV